MKRGPREIRFLRNGTGEVHIARWIVEECAGRSIYEGQETWAFQVLLDPRKKLFYLVLKIFPPLPPKTQIAAYGAGLLRIYQDRYTHRHSFRFQGKSLRQALDIPAGVAYPVVVGRRDHWLRIVLKNSRPVVQKEKPNA
jgi:hypothetical protein